MTSKQRPTTPAGHIAARARYLVLIATGWLLLSGAAAQAQLVRLQDPTPYCGDEGVWIQILGGGGPELDDDEANASYLIFLDNQARLLVDPAPGSSYLFDRAGGRIGDLDAIVLTRTGPDRSADLPAFVSGGRLAGRDRTLTILGPDGNDEHPATDALLERLFGPTGAYPQLAAHLDGRGVGGFRLAQRTITATGTRRWGGFASEHLKLAAIPVHHGGIPALAWRAEIGGMTIVFAGDLNNQKGILADFAKGADALIIHHSVPEGARGELTDSHVTPGQIGRIAAQAGVRMVILGHRMNRTRGRESLTTAAIEEHFKGPLIFADDLECWGL